MVVGGLSIPEAGTEQVAGEDFWEEVQAAGQACSGSGSTNVQGNGCPYFRKSGMGRSQ